MQNQSRNRYIGRFGRRCRFGSGLFPGLGLAVLMTFGAWAQPAPLVNVPFSEGSGTTTANIGAYDDLGTFAQQNSLPVFSSSVPSGDYAPAANTGSVDFGTIGAGDGGRAIDFPTPMGPMSAFTVCGWVNCRDLTVGAGGNRIAFALQSANGPGFDLVHQANGSLRLGINQWPDASGGGQPISSAGKITADPNAEAANWVFFAVTYDGTLANGQVKYYFGSATAPVALDVTRDYNRGSITTTQNPLTLGNFGTVIAARNESLPVNPNGSRVFRGLLDEIKVFSEALLPEQILAAQTNGVISHVPLVFVQEPADQEVVLGADATFSVEVTGSEPITYQWQRDNVNIDGATESSYTLSGATADDNGAQFRVLVTNPAGTIPSRNATLSVIADTTPPTVIGVVVDASLMNLTVTFSEPVDEGSAEDPGSYILDGGNLSTLSAELQADLTNVVLTTDLLQSGVEYTLSIYFILDRALPVPNELAPTNWVFTTPVRTAPMFEARFEEGSGASVTNSGSAGEIGTIDFGLGSSASGLPAFVPNVPTGQYAPPQNTYSLDFGTSPLDGPYAGKAVDFSYTVKSNTVGLTEFTVTGWINVTDGNIGSGGNRIIGTWANAAGGNTANRLTGFDVVVAGAGDPTTAPTIRLGVNQAPDYPTPPGNIGPTSSAGRIGISPTGDPGNWVFFAVTYDASLSSENAKFYFGKADAPASQDTGATLVNYNRGAIANATVERGLTLGNFVAGHTDDPGTRDSTSNSRAFRGLMDEIRFFPFALTLEEIQEIQTTGGVIPAPTLAIRLEAGQAVMTWTSSTPLQLMYRDALDSGAWTAVSETPEVDGDQYTVRVATDQPTRFFSLQQ